MLINPLLRPLYRLLHHFHQLLLILHYNRRHVTPTRIPQLVPRHRHVPRNLEHHMIGHNIADALVLDPRDVVPPLDEALQRLELCERLQTPVPPHDHVVVVVLDHGLLVRLQAEARALVVHLPQVVLGVRGRGLEALVEELLPQEVVDIEEVVGVLAGVAEHLGGEGAESPVGELVLLVGEDGAVVVEKVGEGEGGEAEDAGGLAGVEEV